MADRDLRQRRERVAELRLSFDGSHLRPGILDRAVVSSWERCHASGEPEPQATISLDETADRWHRSPVRRYAADVLGRVTKLVQQEDYVAAVVDKTGTVIWTAGSASLRQLAEETGFVIGSTWSEQTAGTNGPGTALFTRQPMAVFADEHWSAAAREWACYAAPILDGKGDLVGALDISTHWRGASDLALVATTSMSELIGSRIPATADGSTLDLRVLGHARVFGPVDHLPLRRLEIVLLLAWHRQLGLQQLHDLLYGHRLASLTTTKAEVSTLRRELGSGAVESRPYALTGPVVVDALQVMQALRTGDLEAASRSYRGEVLPASEAPGVVDIRHELTVSLRNALLAAGSGPQLLRFARVHRFDLEVIDTCLERAPTGSPTSSTAAALRDAL